MKIGIDGTLLHGNYSGVEYSIHHLLNALVADDRENKYIIHVGANFQPDPTSPTNFEWKHTSFPATRRLRRIFWQQWQLPPQLLLDGVDVFHGPGYITPVHCPVPSVVTVYDVIALTHPELCSMGNRLHYRWMLPRVLRRATRAIVPSEAVRDDVLHLFPEITDRIRVVPLGIDGAFFDQPDTETLGHVRAKYHLPEHFILFLGNLERKKNLSLLVQAFSELKAASVIPHRLVLAGCLKTATEDLHKSIEDTAAGATIRLLDYVPGEDLPSLYQLADVFVLPSLVEGFGLPVLESMALGTPVVASNRGALPEIVADAGLLCDPEDRVSLTDALLRLITDEGLRDRLIEAGRIRARQFTWKTAARRVMAIYREAFDAGASNDKGRL